MKLFRSNPWRGFAISRVFGAFFYHTETIPRSAPQIDSLYLRILQAGDPRVPIVRVIDQWLEEGRDVQNSELHILIKQFRKCRRFKHALQISEWSSEHRNPNPFPGHIAVRLDLISKVHGLEEAEKYLDSIPDTSRITSHVYGALLKCYAEHKSLDKAEATMQKMRELGFLKSSLPYNDMLTLYSRMGKTEKLDSLMQEMERKGIDWDKFTGSIRLNAYAATSDIKGMEKLLMKMEADPEITICWNAYASAANGYLKAGLHEKTIEMLKKAEQLVSGKTRKSAYEIFLTLYAAIQNKAEVYRIWTLYGGIGKVWNSGYLSMMSSLVKLDDLDGAEKILEEWVSVTTFLDFRIPRVLITAYCEKGLLEKAEAYIDRFKESGMEVDPITLDRLASGYHAHGQVEKAVETMKQALLAGLPGFKPNRFILAEHLEYLKEKGDVEAAEEILRLLRENCHFSTAICEKLRSHIHVESPSCRKGT
ncbi:pentatricopeptide repeat-containing protein At2g20710, mitochondrial-like [Juglans microcarpa x Juglans regia]|uniref:pentatricopeptide repeat-containing protein At2g20710, mitochondrial-like n=1 Tax=Juglans microcarpa x Juglans regia TaxID=2249226 RepID=UPI001B7EF964|nr:pentatricopeptide repeat-containing protein At2g20710, mitochondrial-like [Juglans microcarpa x Juglans regia]